jgi:hypothetical protein
MDLNDNSVSSNKEKIKNILNTQPTKQSKTQLTSTNNITEAQTQNDNNNKKENLSIYNFINEMPFENLNDYYDIESSLFYKRIEKLNLKFYWTSECILNQQDIKYPYNKLFLILFKQISLYIEEIARLNKQLKQKIKNEKHFQIKIAQMKQKENENTLNKQMLKNLQRDNKILEKKNEKYKNEIEKLNKKLENSLKTMTVKNTSVNGLYRNTNKENNYFYGSPRYSNNSMGYDSVNTQESIMSKQSNKKVDVSGDKNKYIINVRVKNKNRYKSASNSVEKQYNYKSNNKEFINQGIVLCDEELENLGIMEDILKEFKSKNTNTKRDMNNSSLDNINLKNSNNNNINTSINSGKSNNKKNKGYSNKTSVPVKKIFHK